jgi:hypothetical protein
MSWLIRWLIREGYSQDSFYGDEQGDWTKDNRIEEPSFLRRHAERGVFRAPSGVNRRALYDL